MTTNAPLVTIVIPVYNEEAIITASVLSLVDRLDHFDRRRRREDPPLQSQWSYHILLAENGSTDRTRSIITELTERFPTVSALSVDEPNYGKALRAGILQADTQFVICDEIDLCDVGFYKAALALLEDEEADLVIGSKRMAGARDERPLLRRAGTLAITKLLQIGTGFSGSDTHGLKAFRRDKLEAIVEACVVDRDLFASELVIRAERNGVRIREIPIRVLEMRRPSINLSRRIPRALKDLVRLSVAVRR